MTRAWTRSCEVCSVRKGLIFLMLCSANLQDRAVVAMCSLKVSWSLKISDRSWWGNCWWTESWSHAVELEWQGRQEAQSLPGWAVYDFLSSMPRCLPSSLRSVQLPLDHLVEMRDRAVCHQRRNGRRSHVPVWWDPVVYAEKKRGPRTDPWGTPVTNWCALMCNYNVITI